MVVTYNHIYSEGFGQFCLFHCLDSTIHGNDQSNPLGVSLHNSLRGHSITFVVAVRNVEIHLVAETAYERMKQGHRRSPIHIVISIDHYLLL